MLHDALEKQKQEANKLNESAIEYNLLKRDCGNVPRALRRHSGEAEGSRRLGRTEDPTTSASSTPPARPLIRSSRTFRATWVSRWCWAWPTGVGLAFLLEGIGQHDSHHGAGAEHFRAAVVGHDPARIQVCA